MSEFYLYFKLDDYLAQWYLNDNGGASPVKLGKGSVESKFLESFLIRRPAQAAPEPAGESNVAIEIPFFRFKPPQTYNYLSKKSRAAFITLIRDRFDVDLWTAVSGIETTGEMKKVVIEAWMESRGIEVSDKNWNAVDKRYMRMKERYQKRERSRKSYETRKKLLK